MEWARPWNFSNPCFVSGRILGEAASLNEPYNLLLKLASEPRLWITLTLFNHADLSLTATKALRPLTFEAGGTKTKKPVISGT